MAGDRAGGQAGWRPGLAWPPAASLEGGCICFLLPLWELLGSQILKTPRQWRSQEDPGLCPAPFWVLVWPCAHQLWDRDTGGGTGTPATLPMPCRGQGQSGPEARQAQLKPPGSPTSLALPQSLAKGLAFNPQGPCCAGTKNPFPLRPPGLPSLSQPRSLPSPNSCHPGRISGLSLKQIMHILASRPLPMLFPLPTRLFLEIFAWLVSAFRSQLKGHFLGKPFLSTPQKPPAAPTALFSS